MEKDNLLHEAQEGDQKISPLLPENVKNYLIDIDGTITDDIPNEEPERMKTCKAYPDALKTLNKWYDKGHRICFFTSRTEDHREITENWLKENGFKYHSLLMGKPRGGNCLRKRRIRHCPAARSNLCRPGVFLSETRLDPGGSGSPRPGRRHCPFSGRTGI